jgi:hypothetical protein
MNSTKNLSSLLKNPLFGRFLPLISALGSQVDASIEDDNDLTFDIDNDGRRWGLRAGQKLATDGGETNQLTLLQER